MPVYNGAVGAVTASVDCATRIGANQILFAKRSSIASVTETNGVVSAITFAGAEKFFDFGAEFAGAEPRAELAAGSTRYQATIENIRFQGQNAPTTFELSKWINTCDVVALVIGVSGVRQLYGIENANNILKSSAKKGKFTSHLNTFGTPDDTDNGPRDEIGYLAEHDYAPLYVDTGLDLTTLV